MKQVPDTVAVDTSECCRQTFERANRKREAADALPVLITVHSISYLPAIGTAASSIKGKVTLLINTNVI